MNMATASTQDFDSRGYVNEDGELTSDGEAALEAHYDRIIAALDEWAVENGVRAEFTDSVRITGRGIDIVAGGVDSLEASPASWVQMADEALTYALDE